MEDLELVCDVRSHPDEAVKFHWSFNNSDGLEVDLERFTFNGTRSTLVYTPSNAKTDYGTVLCFANNEVGRQREACVFQVRPAGKKKGVHTHTLIGGRSCCSAVWEGKPNLANLIWTSACRRRRRATLGGAF